MTRTTSQLAPSPNFRTTPEGGDLSPTVLTCTGPAYTESSSLESGFEPGTLRPPDLKTRRPRSHKSLRYQNTFGAIFCKNCYIETP
ncbi:hypothetical protein AVEN_187695-1 [Araneus ventricosus]|uniref:Uncharacterized protein n=1 Tax=Araneus ventricosus TaxID=182803 RepID=A0A4Y2C2K9_ARAVE|nr:hypothetical protein AVEN_187695-1 [Araneus ventricosus]